MPSEYTVSVANTFEADSFEDALRQMIAWLDDYAYAAGYRISWDDQEVFVDAERILARDWMDF